MATAFNRVRYLYNLGVTDTATFDVTVAGDSPGGLITTYIDLLDYATELMDRYTLGGSPDRYAALKAALHSSDHLAGVNAQYVVGTAVIGSAYSELGSPEAGAGATRHDFSTAWVVSLRTDEAGRTARGRCYFPATGVSLDATGVIEAPTPSAFADGFGNLLADVTTAHTDPTAEIQVYSRTLDILRPVTRVLVDSRPDNQRRRLNKLTTAYQTSGTYPV